MSIRFFTQKQQSNKTIWALAMEMISMHSLSVFWKKQNQRHSVQNYQFPNWNFHNSSIISKDSKHKTAMDPQLELFVFFLQRRKQEWLQ